MTQREDLTGHTYGEWTVLGFSHKDDSGAAFWYVRCSCGAERSQRGWVLKKGKSTRCRDCSAREASARALRKSIAELPGTVCGTWLVLSYVRTVQHNTLRCIMWACQCTECGAVVDLPRDLLYKPMLPVCRHGVAPTTVSEETP